MPTDTKDRIRRIYQALPQLNCGQCGYGSCGRFARAVAEGEASPFGCRQDPAVGYRIRQVLAGRTAPTPHGLPLPVSAQKPKPLSPALLREELGGLSVRADDIIARIERLAERQRPVQRKASTPTEHVA